MSRDSDSNRDSSEYWEQRKIAWERRKMGLEFRHRYELYFVTLTFTLLGLAVQTAKSSTSVVIQFIEFGGWFLLFLSGLLGFYILESLWRREVGVAEISDLFLQGLPHRDLEKDVNKVERRFQLLKNGRWVLFVAALVCLMVSRGFIIISIA